MKSQQDDNYKKGNRHETFNFIHRSNYAFCHTGFG